MKNAVRFCLFPLALLGFFLLLLSSKEVAASVLSCIDFLLYTLLPTLFPFLFLGALLTDLSVGTKTPKLFTRAFTHLFRLPPSAWKCIFVGLFCGFPSGVLSVARSFENGELDPPSARRLSLFVNMPSPAFCISAFGVNVLNSPILGFIVYLSCVVSSFLCMLIASRFSPPPDQKAGASLSVNLTDAFTSALTRSCKSFAIICALVIISKTLWVIPEQILSYCDSPTLLSHALYGMLDAAGGCTLMPTTDLWKSTLLGTFFLSLQGLCVLIQSMEGLKSIGVNPTSFFLARLAQAALSCIFVSFFLKFLGFL